MLPIPTQVKPSVYSVWLPMHQLQWSWVRSQHPTAQWNMRGGRRSSAENSTKKAITLNPGAWAGCTDTGSGVPASEGRTYRPRDACPKGASSKGRISLGRIVQGSHRPRVASYKGRIVQETHRPRDASPKRRVVQEQMYGETDKNVL